MATIKEVAELAGLSRTTVSRVINNEPFVTEEKRKLVLEAMDQLGYVPNSSAQRLRKNKTETVAVLISRIINPFFSRLVDEMELIASKSGFKLILCNTRCNKENELKYLEMLKTKQVDGIILVSIENKWEDIEPFCQYGPIIMCNEYHDDATIPVIRLDQVKGGYIGTKHLIDLGHKRIAYCGGDMSGHLSQDRQKGYWKAMEEAGLPVYKSWEFPDSFGICDGRSVLQSILELENRPTAVFTGSDEVAVGVILEAKERGLQVPDDMAVVGFDNQPLAEVIDPPLTTIEQSVNEIGKKAMEVMFDVIDNKRKIEKSIDYLPIKLIVRQSTLK
ncbi:LacI family DNA-binding transcriptional regulator [Halalkalibacter lacteus]|uniref:LacI family DNA-binding transcriptional regulator n=1 Tax=Halalkalibacter lacteus TaxID=3090663 RepID=UPI002FC7B09D